MTTIAVAGTHGFLFKPMVAAFTSELFSGKYALPVIALTRDVATEEPIDGVKFVQVDYADPATVVAALKGVDALVNLIGFAPDIWTVLVDAAVTAGVGKYFPSEFGCDYRKLESTGVKTFLSLKADHATYARKAGIPKVVSVVTGLFSKLFVFGFMGHDFKNGTAQFYGDGTQKVTTTDLADIGLSVASLAYRPASELPDYVAVQGNAVTLNETVDIYEAATGKKLTVTYTPAPDFSVATDAESTDIGAKLKTMSAHPECEAFSFSGNDNEFVNPGLWKWVTIADFFKA
ncbi:uncharacterized protein V1518DRAFT_394336 [Limtongia smithiae]|uniref:uncharacterized protein n=1 Tax=Limtongia smithiae TaxID=1125753 RepID=UPI0034CE8C01